MNEAYIQQDLGFNDKALNTSFIEIDAPNSAKKEANVTEIIIAKSKADSVQMLLPMLTKLNQEQRWLALIDPPSELLHRWKSERKTDLNEIIVLRSNKQISGDALCQKALAMGTCHAAILWTKGINNEFFEQLERASIEGDSHGILVRSR